MTVKEIKAMIEGMNDNDKVEIFTKEVKLKTNPLSGRIERTENWKQIEKHKKIYIVKAEEN